MGSLQCRRLYCFHRKNYEKYNNEYKYSKYILHKQLSPLSSTYVLNGITPPFFKRVERITAKFRFLLTIIIYHSTYLVNLQFFYKKVYVVIIGTFFSILYVYFFIIYFIIFFILFYSIKKILPKLPKNQQSQWKRNFYRDFFKKILPKTSLKPFEISLNKKRRHWHMRRLMQS